MEKIITLAIALTTGGFFISVSAQQTNVPEKIQNHFKATYPAAQAEDWDHERDGSYEVEFTVDGIEWEAYYAINNEWLRTERDVKRSEVPQAVLDGLAKSEYAAWKVDDIEEHQNSKYKSFYEIELKNNGSKVYVSILPDGTLIK